VPLTPSLYVPGTLKDAGKVLVDVGTGYYIEKAQPCDNYANIQTSDDARKFYTAKVEFLDNNMSDLEKVIGGKASNVKGTPRQYISLTITVISDVLQQKLTSAASESA
jgi:prefoldin alpha subunit